MAEFDYDLFVIGGGSGGVRAARRAAERGAKVLLAEAKALGGTCVNAGCIPKKLFAYAASFDDDFADACGFGWASARPAFDWPRLIAAKDAEIARLNGAYERVLRKSGAEIVFARAALAGVQTVAVDGRTVRARSVLVATGGAPARPKLAGQELGFTSDEAFHLPHLPRRVLVLGGGYVAAEFASIFLGLGVEVTLAYRGERLLKGFDSELALRLGDAMAARGIAILPRAEAIALARTSGGTITRFADGRETASDAVMFATGRAPATGGLGLDEIGVRRASSGAIVVDGDFRSSVPWLYAIGDAIDRLRLTPVALAEAEAMVAALYHRPSRKLDYALVPSAVFSRPPLASVGLSEDAARAAGMPIKVFRQGFRPSKGRLSGRTEETVVKLVVDAASDRVLGAHMLGPDAPEIVQGLAIALRAGATKADFDATVGIHPTAAEEFVTLRRPA